MGRTLIIVRRTLTEPNTALAGVILAASFARFVISMATFNKERGPSRRLCRREFASMVDSRGGCEKWRCRQAVRKGPNPNTDERPFRSGAPRASRLFDECNCIRGRSRCIATRSNNYPQRSRQVVETLTHPTTFLVFDIKYAVLDLGGN